MRDREVVSRMLRRFGEKVTVKENARLTEVYAVIQPMLYKNKMYIDGKALPAGYFDGGHYLMIASADIGITDYRNTTVTSKNVSYRIKRAEVIYSGDTELFVWLVLTPSKTLVEDDYAEYDKCA